jgi:hypothetical protein
MIIDQEISFPVNIAALSNGIYLLVVKSDQDMATVRFSKQ